MHDDDLNVTFSSHGFKAGGAGPAPVPAAKRLRFLSLVFVSLYKHDKYTIKFT
jgi:hypothetical protein